MRSLNLLAILLFIAAGPLLAGGMAPNLEQALVDVGPDDFVPIVVMMEEFPSQTELLAEVRGLNRHDRREHVVSRLKELSARSQSPIRKLFAVESEEVRKVRVLWGINGVALEATPRVIDRLAAIPGVRWLLHDHGRGHPEGAGPTGGDTSGPNPDAEVRGEVIAMGAEQVWNELGYTGAGVIVAVIDTGIDRTHPDLADHIWTNLDELPTNGIDDDSNGYIDDSWGWDFCLENNDPSYGDHGTQVAGQVAGDGTNGIVTGMAPDAELMALGIDCDTPSASWAASDYAIAGGAHIITQSYSWWWTDQPDYEAFRRQTDVELAAGVIHANSAGNHGTDTISYPVPYNISTPANCPAPWIHPDQTLAGGVSSVIGVGNISWSTDILAASSSTGPAAWEDIRANSDPEYPYPMAVEYQDYPYENGAQMGLIKPDISAYGNGTYTTCPGGYYCGFSGTSSATPHVAGTLALMIEANQGATPAELAETIMLAAEHRGDPGKNNFYGTGLLQAYAAVSSIESGVVYISHLIDDGTFGNGDMMIDPGEQVVMQITIENRSDLVIAGLEGILSSRTPGITIHNRHATFPSLPVGGTGTSDAPHYSMTIDPAACSTIVIFDLELRYGGEFSISTFTVRVGEPETVVLLEDGFESDLGWSTDAGTATQGFWVREDPIGVLDYQSRLANPEDDTSDPGNTCYVTGNGELTGKKDENNNDVDGGAVTLTSPSFGRLYMLSLNLSYDRWYYDVDSGNSFRAEISNNGGMDWMLLEEWIYSPGGWYDSSFDLFSLLPPTDDMLLRFMVEDEGTDHPVEGAVDEILAEGIWVRCQDYDPPAASAPNPIGNTLMVDKDAGGHALLSWDAPLVDGSHDAATLYRVDRATSAAGSFIEAGSATTTNWFDIDALRAGDSYYYLVSAENAGGGE